MDILHFIDSKEIRDNLEKSSYKFSTLEAAYIIYCSVKTTLTEKHQAWEEIIKSMPDCKIPIDENEPAYNSIHALLRKHIDLDNEMLEKFMNAKNSIYKIDSDAVFSSYEACINGRKKDVFKKRQEYYWCTRVEIDNPYSADYLFLNENFEISNAHFEIDLYEEDYLEYAFDDDYFFDLYKRFVGKTSNKKAEKHKQDTKIY